MKGLELSKAYYKEFGENMLKSEFPDLYPLLAVGFTGSGSERYGFDDEISRDHDFDVGFSIFLPKEELIDSRQEFLLERAYAKLPKEFMGVTRKILSPVGGNRNGVVRTADFFKDKIGVSDGNLTVKEWLSIPDYALCEAVNGEIFYDGFGEVTKIRNRLSDIPEDIRKKRIAGNILIMAQSGQYNFMRCVNRGEKEGAFFALNEFVNATVKALFLVKGKFAPYYKWSFHALKLIEENDITDKLSFLMLKDNDNDKILKEKYTVIEQICNKVKERLKSQKLIDDIDRCLETSAYSVNDKIEDGEIRNLNILVSVN